MKAILCGYLMALSACSSAPKCVNASGAAVVYISSNTCEVRIKQVVIGSSMKIPESLKGTDLATFEMVWVETALVNGQIHLGHFALVPKSGKGTHEN